ncbi:DUF58 domain-containing protein [Colwellia sp. RSH04]|uniref:DUF58 domain-containing protein n=1 Tax=Colwellia sp. RSH04 TaxID=2305464 RepID=UPI000E56D591|nr:DUF58 domain-containing protein [Colwellia sp. RSH04]RHW75286.1 DUF58 domain-containing protein [Colwellia sp. RSH04]
MWFKQFFSNRQHSDNQNNHCDHILASIQSNGVDLSMSELLQYQSKSALIDLTARKNIHGRQSGNYLSRSKGRGMEFDEVRHYQTGDDIRAIDWRVTARTGKTHTKLFREEIERPVLIATDLSTNMHFGSKLLFKSVQAAHLAALVAWHAKERGDRLGGIVFNQNQHKELKPRSRKEGVLHYLHALTSVHQSSTEIINNITTSDNLVNKPLPSETVFTENCARIRQLAKPGSLVYFITDASTLNNHSKNSHTVLRHLSQISQHCELVICLISDPLEHNLPSSDVKFSVNITDGQDKQQLTLGDENTSEQYHQVATSIMNDKKQQLIETGARVVELSAGLPLELQLRAGGN